MKFGIHIDISVGRPFEPDTERRAFGVALEQAIQADALGFDYCWAAEHHFLEEYSHLPAPEVFLAAVAAKTSRIRLGASLLSSPDVAPFSMAERAAVVDLLSNGRLDLGLGRPVTWSELSGSAAWDPARPDVWQETLRAIAQIWTNDRCALNGTHFVMPERAIRPMPCQKPHPPLWMAGAGQDVKEASSLGLGLLSPASGDYAEQARRVADYREGLADARPAGSFINGQFAVWDLLYCHDGEGRGAAAGERLINAHRDLTAQQVSARELGLGGALPSAAGLAIGDPRSIIDVLRAWEAMGVDCVVFALNAADALSREEALASLRLFALEVMPVFTRQRTRAAAE